MDGRVYESARPGRCDSGLISRNSRGSGTAPARKATRRVRCSAESVTAVTVRAVSAAYSASSPEGRGYVRMERLVQLADVFDDWLGIAFGFLSAEQIAAGIAFAAFIVALLILGVPFGLVVVTVILGLPFAQLVTLARRAIRARLRTAYAMERPTFAPSE